MKQDYAQAADWYRKAATQGDLFAETGLALLYAKGDGVKRDYAEAAKWYAKAAARGDAFAQSNLGFLYANGQGVKQDYVQAYKWFDLAASHGPADNRATAVSNRDIMADKLSATQIKQAQALSAGWEAVALICGPESGASNPDTASPGVRGQRPALGHLSLSPALAAPICRAGVGLLIQGPSSLQSDLIARG